MSGKEKGKIEKLQKQEKEYQQKQAGKAQTTQLKEFQYDNQTKEGEKKNISGAWPQAYNPQVIEQNWYAWWEKQQFFEPEAAQKVQNELYQKLTPEEKQVIPQQQEQREQFTMLIPPPNRTSNHLHCGHSFTVAIEDALTRFYRQNGYITSWIPGSDHAGIAAQAVFEKYIGKKGLKKTDLGRDEFIKQMWQWIDECGDGIMGQLKLLGTSVDWKRKYFTLDQERNKVHDQAFIKLFNKGKIYRANRLTSWDCTLQTAISDVEIDYMDLSKPTQWLSQKTQKTYPMGYLWSFSYLVVPESLTQANDEEIRKQWNEHRELFTEKLTFATTRPETMFGDSAVAIHPEDPRYKKFQGRRVFSPLTQTTLPIICDETLVDMNFGTGVVKVTPAHDPNDFQTGLRHKLPQINMLNKDGTIYAPTCPQFNGMYRFDARIQIIKFFTELNLYEGKQPNKMAIGVSQRSGDIIEPLLVPQWWMNCEEAAAKASEAVNLGKLLIIPEVHKRTWEKYLGNIQPWCISRQLWWGHRIPLYKCWKSDCQEPDGLQTKDWIAAMSEQEAIQIFRQQNNIQDVVEIKCIRDSDVTDTWFSSGLLPLSLSGWPTNPMFTEEYCNKDYKEKEALTSILETGHDILFFWVARMVMMSLELTNTLPFSEVLLHSMVRDSRGEKMSKSKGNVIDPVDLIRGASLDKLANDIKQSNLIESEIAKALKLQKAEFPLGIPICGADAQRFCLVSYSGQVQGINLDVNQVVAERNFCNKIFNATKLVCTSCEQMKLDTKQMKSQESMFLYLSQNLDKFSLADKYVLYNLLQTQHKYAVAILSNDFGTATQTIKTYFWQQLCDIYFELVKSIINGQDEEAKQLTLQNMFFCVDQSIRMLSVFMPYLCEEMWQHLPRYQDEKDVQSICLTQMLNDLKQCKFGIQNKEEVATDKNCLLYKYRNCDELKEANNKIEDCTSIAGAIRSAKASVGIMKKTKAYIKMLNQQQLQQDQLNAIKILSTSEEISQITQEQSQQLQNCISKTENVYTVYVDVAGLVDVEKEIAKCIKQKEILEKSISKLEQLKQKPTYSKMPENVRQGNEEKLVTYNKQLEEINASLVQWNQMKQKQN